MESPKIIINTEADDEYMLNPYKYRMKRKFDPNMFMLGERDLCANPFYGYMINPNKTVRNHHEQYMMYPHSNAPIRKEEYNEKNKFRLYPHMFQQPTTNDDDNNDDNGREYGTTYGGVDYPIPKRFELSFLQDKSQIGGVDYDMILENNNSNYRLSNEGEWDNGEFTPVIETRDSLKHSLKQQSRTLDEYTDIPNITLREKQLHLHKKRQEQAIEIPRISVPFSQLETISPKCVQNKNDSECLKNEQSQILTSISDDELQIFGKDVDRSRPQYQTYPSKQAQKTGFFELGPAIPPPNPMLLSNVPSGIMVPTTIPRKMVENFEPSIMPSENSQHIKSLQGDLEQKIIKIVEQKREIWKQISEVRNQMDALKQRELDAKAQSDMIDISNSIKGFGTATRILNRLRQIGDYLDKQQTQLMNRLENIGFQKDFQQFQKLIQNRIKHYQTEIKQYNETPDDNQVFAYQMVNFEGDAYRMKTGFYDYPSVGGIGSQKLKSLKIGKNVSVILYNKPNRKGKVLVYHGPKRVHTLPILWETGVNGIEIIVKPTEQIQVFDAPFYQGGSWKLSQGFYDFPHVGGLGQGRLNSIVIPAGLKVKLYSRPNKQGETIEFIGPQKMSFLPSGWNKKVFGIEVFV